MIKHTISPVKLLALSALSTTGLIGSTALASPMFTDVNLGSAGQNGLNLSVFVTGPTTFSASNSGTLFGGNVGLGPGSSTNFSGGGTIHGNLFVDPSASLQSNFASQFNVTGITMTQSMSQAIADVQNAATLAAALTPDQTFGSVGGSALTLNASGPLNAVGGHNTVVSIANISISNPGDNMTISGGPNDFFIINVGSPGSTGTVLNVTNGTIGVAGGIPVSHVLFNLLGTGDLALTNASSTLNGTYLAPFSGQAINLTPGTVNGAVIGYTVHTSSGPIINGSSYVPAPGATGVAALALGLAAKRRRRA